MEYVQAIALEIVMDLISLSQLAVAAASRVTLQGNVTEVLREAGPEVNSTKLNLTNRL